LIETHGQDAHATTPLEQFAQENKTFMDSSAKNTKKAGLILRGEGWPAFFR
jgi:hypothetical protein